MSVCKQNENPCVGESAIHVSVIDNEISEKYVEIMIAETMQSLCIPIEQWPSVVAAANKLIEEHKLNG